MGYLCLAQVAAAVVYCLFSSGIIFGYAALKPILIKEGVYRDLCSNAEVGNGEDVCYEQEIRYVDYILLPTVECIFDNESG